MNYARLGLAAVAATVVDAVYGYTVYGNIISNEFAKYPLDLPLERVPDRIPAADVCRTAVRDARCQLPVRKRI